MAPPNDGPRRRRRATARLAVWAVGLTTLRVVGLPAESCGDGTAAAMEQAARLAVGWITTNQQADDSYVYLFDLEAQAELSGYNIVRHAGVTMSLYQAAAYTGDLTVLPAADRGLAYMQRRLLRDEGWTAFTAGEPPQLGASALLLAALLQRRLATGDPEHDELIGEVGAFVLRLQQPDGSFLSTLDPDTGEPVPGERSLYATGEAFWALTLLDRAFPGEGWRAPARSVSRYLATERDEVEDVDWGLWADQWAAYGLDDAGWVLDADEVAYARRLAERFGLYVRTESQRESNALARLVRGGKASGAGLGVEAEALGSLWRLARSDERLADLEPALRDRLVCAGGILASRQVWADGDDEPSPLTEGAWFTDGVTRMDDQQHALSGLLAALEAVAEDGAVAGDGAVDGDGAVEGVGDVSEDRESREDRDG